jgi:uncharacterized membrane protein YoaK (UPF0700 family)
MAAARPAPTGWQDSRAFLIGITAAAGWLDALAFLRLGKVFNSVMTGNVLFLGLGVGDGDGARVLRAGIALIAFAFGAFVGARLVGRGPTADVAARLPGALVLEGALLAVFAALWLAAGGPAGHSTLQVVLLGIGAVAMGVQAAIALAMKIPNVATVALTATIAQLGAFAGWRGRDGRVSPDVPSPALMGALILTYFVGALIVAVAPDWPVLALGPAVLLAGGLMGWPAPQRLPAEA